MNAIERAMYSSFFSCIRGRGLAANLFSTAWSRRRLVAIRSQSPVDTAYNVPQASRLPRWSCSALALLSTVLLSVGAVARPNVVLIIADDISPDFSCFGGQVQTPNVDALAAQGVRFDNAYVTASSCSPSRNSIITGRYPHNTGAPELHMDLPEGQFMFPQALKEAGYYSVLSGKWHMGEATRPAFDVVDAVHYPNDPTGAENWIKLLRERPKDQPFFMWFAAFDAHRPWEADEKETPHNPAKLVLPAGIPDTPMARQDFAAYCDEVRRFDRYVGGVVAELKTQGVYENTLIILLGDNGRPFPRSKTSLYDAGMKTPLVVHWPEGKLKTGGVSKSLVSSIDIAPAILEAAGLSAPPQVQGISLLPICRKPELKTREVLYGERNWHVQRACGRMVRKGDWVYMRDFTPGCYSFQMVNHKDGSYAELLRLQADGKLTPEQAEVFSIERPEEQLFNITSDPQQLKNLAGNPEHKQKLGFFRTALAEWQETTGDSIPAVEEMTPDRHDRETYERLFQGGRPPTGIIAGEQAGAETLVTRASVNKDVVGTRYVYKTVDDRELSLYVTRPDDWKAGDSRPAVVFFHGGGWTKGKPGQFTEHSKYLASRGMVCFQVEYRLIDKKIGETPMKCIQDAKSAMRWVRSRAAEFGIDPARIASGGGSAGGHLAAFVGMVDGMDDPQDNQDVSAKSNAMLLFNPVFDNGPDGYGYQQIKERYPVYSPFHNITADDPPALVFLGDQDTLIPVETAYSFEKQLKAVGVNCEVMIFEGMEHGFFNHGKHDNKPYLETIEACDRFLAGLGWITGEPAGRADDG